MYECTHRLDNPWDGLYLHHWTVGHCLETDYKHVNRD